MKGECIVGFSIITYNGLQLGPYELTKLLDLKTEPENLNPKSFPNIREMLLALKKRLWLFMRPE